MAKLATIFSEMIKIYLVRDLENIVVTSLIDDRTKSGRNPALSKYKRTCISDVVDKIQQALTLEERSAAKPFDTDQELYTYVHTLLITCRDLGNNESDRLKAGRGKFDASTTTVITFLNDINKKFEHWEELLKNEVARHNDKFSEELEQIKLFNVDFNTSSLQENHPFTVFLYNMAHYITNHIDTIRNATLSNVAQGVMDYASSWWNSSADGNAVPVSIPLQKQDKIIESLVECHSWLSALDEKKPNYLRIRNKLVIQCVGNLKGDNFKIADDNSIKPALPLSGLSAALPLSGLTFFSNLGATLALPSLGPGEGTLKDFLELTEQQLTMFDAPVPAHHSTQSSSSSFSQSH